VRATYRLQLGPGLGFAEAAELVPYLAGLGVSHVYLSPCLQARPGSTHGYDVVDPTRISADLGGEGAFRALLAAAHEHGLGVVMDIVPNHMATDADNRLWADEKLRAKFFDWDPETGAYRRFFDIDDLAGVRQEDPEVFAATHAKVLALVAEGLVDGLRIDHPDGLADPAGYLIRLREHGVRQVWVEKILESGERLPDWPVEGTVGYEFLADVQALWVDPAGEGVLEAMWRELDPTPWAEVRDAAKLEQARTTFAGDVARIGPPATPEAVAALPVYRTYVRDGHVSAQDREAALALPPDVRRRMLLEEEASPGWLTRFEQTTPPVMAKGVEDTAFYRYLRLLALNEVGGDPGHFSLDPQRFHRRNAERAARFPRGLLVTQTHDTKRSGDVRARIGALAGMAAEWRAHVGRWREVNAPLGAPDAREEYAIYQTLVGAWPIAPERMEAYLEKFLREAKRTSNWIEPDLDHEGRVKAFCRALYDHAPFRESFDPFAARVAAAAHPAILGQTLLKLTCPGVADIYQGDELESLSLVDPDNRRPVDWAERRRLLGSDEEPDKLFLIRTALAVRARHEEAFAGPYAPEDAGPAAVAFRRGEVWVGVRLQGTQPLEPPAGHADAFGGRFGDGLILAEPI